MTGSPERRDGPRVAPGAAAESISTDTHRIARDAETGNDLATGAAS